MDKNEDKNLNNFDFLILLGSTNIEEKEKQLIINRLNRLVWEGFLSDGLEKELDEKEIQIINQMARENKATEVIIDYIRKTIPNLKEILENLFIKVKKDIIKEHYQKVIEESDKALFYPTITQEERDSARRIKEKYLKARDLFEEGNWLQLSQLMNSFRS